MEILSPEMAEYGISVTAVSIENVDFTDAFTDAVEDKQVAEQTKLRTEIEQAQLLVVAQTDAERRVIAANADAQEREILAEADASVKQDRGRRRRLRRARAGRSRSRSNALIAARSPSSWSHIRKSSSGMARCPLCMARATRSPCWI